MIPSSATLSRPFLSRSTWRSAAAALGLLGLAAAPAQATDAVVAFIGPTPLQDAIWMADDQGYFAEQDLAVTLRVFPSGTTALQTFQSGQGDIVLSGELPAMRYWLRTEKDYRVIALVERNAATYRVTARNEIETPQDLVGKTIATRVGSTGSWFISEYLAKNGIAEDQVEIVNLDTQVLPTALCGGDIDAFFIWEPFGTRAMEICPDDVKSLGDAEGYINGYALIGARKSWLDTEEGARAATGFVRAMIEGRDFAAGDFDAVAAYASEKYGMTPESAKVQWSINNRVTGLDETFYTDHCNLAAWMRANDLMDGEFDASEYVWTDGLEAIDPALVAAPPGPC